MDIRLLEGAPVSPEVAKRPLEKNASVQLPVSFGGRTSGQLDNSPRKKVHNTHKS